MLVNENTLKLQSRMAAEVGKYYAANRTCMWQPVYYGVTYRSKFSQGFPDQKINFQIGKRLTGSEIHSVNTHMGNNIRQGK